nr:isoform 2 of 1-aminocyclopropane-1-carboxylate oxidase like 2 [Quercus suber]
MNKQRDKRSTRTNLPFNFSKNCEDGTKEALKNFLGVNLAREDDKYLVLPLVMEAVDRVRRAAEEVGLFQVVNHGIGERVLEEMLEAARGFHELPREEKAEYYSRDQRTSKVNYDSNFDLYKSKFANWRDTLFCVMSPHHQPLDPKELPPLCRDISIEYSKQVHKLGITLFELLSEASNLTTLNAWNVKRSMFFSVTTIQHALSPN